VAFRRRAVATRRIAAARQLALLILEGEDERRTMMNPEITVNRQLKKVTIAVKEWTKSFGIPALIVAGWVAAAALLASEMAAPVPAQAAIEKVLATPATQTASVSLPTDSHPVARVHRTRVHSIQ
jgi:hypothetical protein